MNTITPQQLQELAHQGRAIDLIDVRTPVEFQEVHIPLARNVPLGRLDPAQFANGHGDEEPLYVVCRTGNRAAQACQKLAAVGRQRLVNVAGGTQAWEAARLPVVRGKSAMSLERQVRIAAGSLVLLGTLLAVTIHPYFIGLSAFVGAGLVFAGVTDTCGMGMLLARCPWNQTCESSASESQEQNASCASPQNK